MYRREGWIGLRNSSPRTHTTLKQRSRGPGNGLCIIFESLIKTLLIYLFIYLCTDTSEGS